MNLNKVDLNLFIVFDAIYTEANLTRAGQIVGITQPAVSNALARLRETFNDPLFVRTAQGMVPTPMAQNIIGPVRNALQLLRVSVQESRTFDAKQANKTYRISMTDLSEQILLPPLFQRLRRLAPAVQIESFQAKRRETTKELAAGRLDATVADSVEGSTGFLKKPEGKGFAFAGPVLKDAAIFGQGAGIAVRKGDDALRNKFNKAIVDIRKNGTYKKVNDKYFAFDAYGE